MKSLLGNSNTRRADITFFSTGRIDISSALSKQLHLHNGDVIDIIEHNSEYYLIVRHRSVNVIGRHVGQCYPTNKHKSCNNYRCYSKQLCRAIVSISLTSPARLCVGLPLELPPYGIGIPLITRNPIK